MPRIVRGALLQASWTGDKESMIQKHEQDAHEAAKQGAQFMLFQELFYGPYFCQVQDPQYYSLHRADPRRPDDQAHAGPRQADRHGRSSCRCTRRTRRPPGIYYNTAAVIDADGTYLGKYRKTHIPHVKGFWEKFYFRPGNMGYPVFETAVGKVGVYICYDRHFPEGARALGLNGAEIVLIPSATSAAACREYLWRIEQVSHAVANGYYVGTINRVGIEKPTRRRRLLRPELLRRPARPVRRRRRQRPRRGAARPRHGPRPDPGGPPDVAVLPRPPARRSTATSSGPESRGTDPSGSTVWRRTAEPLDSRRGGRATMQFGFTLKPEHTDRATRSPSRARRRRPASTTAGCSTRTSCGASPIRC